MCTCRTILSKLSIRPGKTTGVNIDHRQQKHFCSNNCPLQGSEAPMSLEDLFLFVLDCVLDQSFLILGIFFLPSLYISRKRHFTL